MNSNLRVFLSLLFFGFSYVLHRSSQYAMTLALGLEATLHKSRIRHHVCRRVDHYEERMSNDPQSPLVVAMEIAVCVSASVPKPRGDDARRVRFVVRYREWHQAEHEPPTTQFCEGTVDGIRIASTSGIKEVCVFALPNGDGARRPLRRRHRQRPYHRWLHLLERRWTQPRSDDAVALSRACSA